RRNGLVFNYDVICFDEINKKTSNLKGLISKLQQIMASNRVERGDLDAVTSVSLVFQGNIRDFKRDASGRKVPLQENHFRDIPKGMQDYAFLDRIHAYIHGWDFPRIESESINRNFGLISSYLGQVFHSLRREDFSREIESRVKFFRREGRGSIGIRDKKAIMHVLSGLTKIIFPDRVLDPEVFAELVELAVKLRQNVVDEIRKVEPVVFSYTLGFQLLDHQGEGGATGGGEGESGSGSGIGSELPPVELVPADTVEVQEVESKWQAYPQLKVYCTGEGLLTKPLPYWFLKWLKVKNFIFRRDGCYAVPVKNQANLPFTFEVEDAPPISGTREEDLDFGREEELLEVVQKKLKDISANISETMDLYHRANLVKTRLNSDEGEQLAIISQIEKQERIFIDNEVPWTLTLFKKIDKKISTVLDLLAESASMSVDLLSLGSAPIFEESSAVIETLNDLACHWNSLQEKYYANLSEVVSAGEKILGESHQNEDVQELFGGKKFYLFSFDVNNLQMSAMKKRPSMADRVNVVEKIVDEVLPDSTDYLALFFASKYFENLQGNASLPQHKWYIEETIKGYVEGRKQYCDVDANLTAVTHTFIDKYHAQIIRFGLGSGDKDLHIVCDLAKEFGIPIDIYISDEKNLSRELRILADEIYELY
ncbi:MAG: BREX system Lon protease-like protein BrxL, partial [Promethearchaeota archaeon]